MVFVNTVGIAPIAKIADVVTTFNAVKFNATKRTVRTVRIAQLVQRGIRRGLAVLLFQVAYQFVLRDVFIRIVNEKD